MNKFKLFLINIWFVLGGCTTTQSVATDPKALKELNPKNAKEYFCNGDKAKRALTQRLVGKTPSFKGLDLGTAQKYKEEYIKQERDIARTFFAINVPQKQKWRNAPKFSGYLSYSTVTLGEYKEKAGTYAFDYNSGKVHAVSFAGAKEIYLVPISTFWSMEDSFYDLHGGSSIKHTENYVPIFEPSVLSENYIMVMPDPKSGKTPPIQQAITEKSDNWITYMAVSTSVKEAAIPDSEDLAFEISLDLNGFCKYGHPLDQLITK